MQTFSQLQFKFCRNRWTCISKVTSCLCSTWQNIRRWSDFFSTPVFFLFFWNIFCELQESIVTAIPEKKHVGRRKLLLVLFEHVFSICDPVSWTIRMQFVKTCLLIVFFWMSLPGLRFCPHCDGLDFRQTQNSRRIDLLLITVYIRSCIGNTFLYQNATSKVGVLPIHETVIFF